MKNRILLLITMFMAVSIAVYAQLDFASINRQRARSLALVGDIENRSLNFHSYSNQDIEQIDVTGSIKYPISSGTQFLLYYPELMLSYNSFIPWSGNDGQIWQGKGINAQTTTGVGFASDNFSLRFTPLFWFAQNDSFDKIETNYSSGYGDYWTQFDNLQSYGDEPYYDFSLGNSDIRFNYKFFSLGISNESIIIGPGQKNNIILSDNAGGFPHIDIGTDGKVPIFTFGDIEVKYIWGLLEESEYFDDDTKNDNALLSGMYLAYAPSFIPNFQFGLNHQYYKPYSEIDSYDFVRAIPLVENSNSPSDVKDMMVSATFSWMFPEIGFEFYGEWARNDHFSNIKDLFNSPEHTHAYTLGINQVLHHGQEKLLILSFELTTLEQERTNEIRSAGPWYRHGWAGWTQGYTHKGQLLGAMIGPGSDSQWLKLALLEHNGFWNLSIQRIAHDKDYYYHLMSLNTDGVVEYAEFNLSLERYYMFTNFDLFIKTAYSYLLGFNYAKHEDHSNIYANIGLRYHW